MDYVPSREGGRPAGKPLSLVVISLPPLFFWHMCPSEWLARLLGYFLGPLQLWTLGLPRGAGGVLEPRENLTGTEICCQQQRAPWPTQGEG